MHPCHIGVRIYFIFYYFYKILSFEKKELWLIMNNYLTIKSKKSLFTRIRQILKGFFNKSSTSTNISNVEIKNDTNVNIEVKKPKFDKLQEIKINSNVTKEIEKKHLFDIIIKNPNLLENLSNEQLKSFIVYGNQIIEKNEIIIKKLSNTN